LPPKKSPQCLISGISPTPQNKPKNKIYPATNIHDKFNTKDCQANKANYFNGDTEFPLGAIRFTFCRLWTN